MRGWPLYVSILVGAVAAAFVLKAIPPGVVIVAALVAVAVVSVRYRRLAKPGKRDAVEAVGLGFARSPTDPFSLRTLPLALFARGSDPEIADVMWGAWGDVETKLFAFGYSDASGARRVFTCALAPSGTHDLALVVEPKTFMIPESDRPPMHVVAIDDAAFAEVFDVRSDAPEAATRVLDDAFRGRLLSLQERWAFELRDRMLLCYSTGAGIDPMESLGTISLIRQALVEPTAPATAEQAEAPAQADGPEA